MFRGKKIVNIFLLVSLVLVLAYFLFFSNKRDEYIPLEISSVVVNIYCVSEYSEFTSGGSGTIWTDTGLIITNSHIIPTDDETGVTDINSVCLVTLPNAETGEAEEIYWAHPIVIPNLSDDYDLAFVQIDDVYIDEETGEHFGDYPKKFSYYTDNKKCGEDYIKLGEPVRVYGYPAISGGYALTITDGIVSSLLLDEGLIVTSAKISHGNSGGLAVDENNCMLGIPTYVSSDDGDSLGVIVSNDLINDFFDEVRSYIELLDY